MIKDRKSKKVLMLNCHEDDVFCFRKEIIEKLIEENYEVILSCPDGERLNVFRGIEGISVEDIEINRRGKKPIEDIKLTMDYVKLIRKYKPDIVLAFTIKPNIYGSIASRIMKVPYINNITGLGSGFSEESIVKRIIISLYKVALAKTQCVFFQNDENFKTANYEKMVQREKCKLIPGSGVNLSRFKLADYPEESEKIIFNYIGRVLKEKGVDNYINAAEKIKNKNLNVEFNIIGFIEETDMDYKEKLKELQSRGIINYRGSQNDVIPYIQRSHCTIHPSIYGEGMSNVLLESAAVGRPIITTTISGCKEIVDDENTGYLYEPQNEDMLVRKIETFMNLTSDEKIEMGRKGRLKVEESFDRKIVVDAYLSEIEKTLKEN